MRRPEQHSRLVGSEARGCGHGLVAVIALWFVLAAMVLIL